MSRSSWLLTLLLLAAPHAAFYATHRVRHHASTSNLLVRGMFSGIVEDMGTVEEINFTKQLKLWDGSVGEGCILSIKSPVAVQDAYIGCSIAVNGVCLTATSYDATTVRHLFSVLQFHALYFSSSFFCFSSLWGSRRRRCGGPTWACSSPAAASIWNVP